MRRRHTRSKKLDYSKLSPIEVYGYVEAGVISRFPNNYITKENMRKIIREVILNRLKLTREDICEKVNYTFLRKYYLGGSKIAFNSNVYNLITYCFPEFDIKYWELNKVENGFWEKEDNRREYMLWLAKKENIDTKSIDDLKRINARLINSNFGSKALKFGGGVYQLVLLIAEVDIKEWQLIKISCWDEEKVKDAVKWMIEEKLKWTHEDVVNNISAKVFYDNDLGGLLSKFCYHSPIKALKIAYPGEYTKVRKSKPEYLHH